MVDEISRHTGVYIKLYYTLCFVKDLASVKDMLVMCIINFVDSHSLAVMAR